MTQEIAVFWAVLFGFLMADNLVLLPRGGDCFRLGRRGRLHYEPGLRLEARGRDLVVLNPLNPFACVLVASRVAGPCPAADWRRVLRQGRGLRRSCDALARVGTVYLVVIAVLLVFTAWLHFGLVLLMLLGAHLLAWALVSHVLWRHRATLLLTKSQARGLIVEALFVPAHTVCMGKRALHRHEVNLPALALGLHRLRRMAAGPDRDLFAHQLQMRLGDLADMAAGIADQASWIKDARSCLTALTPPAGS